MKLVDQICYGNFKASGRLPSPKGVALAILNLLQRDDFNVGDLVRLVQSDPAIALELLKFSNTANFGHRTPVVSLPKAVTILGTRQVGVIVSALSILRSHRSGDCPQFDYEKFWSRALAAAISAQALASYAHINADENFTAGLLCSLGELALASVFPERYGEIISESDDGHNRVKLEQEAFGCDHRELSATLVLEWGAPLKLATAIYNCEAPDESDIQDGTRTHGLTLCLHIALAAADICVAGDDGARKAMLPNLYAKAARLEISEGEMNSTMDGIIVNWKEWGKQLKIQTREVVSFA